MPKDMLVIYRERLGSFEMVGSVVEGNSGASFSYAEAYLQSQTPHAISHALPLRGKEFSVQETESFFEGILPEGSMRKSLNAAFHADTADVYTFMERLNNESAGALVFKKPNEQPDEERSYIPLDEKDFERFSSSPREFAPHAARRSRLSLAGAQMKAGLFFNEDSETWHYPQGTAPSSHIVKVGDGTFPQQTINEAICMATAVKLGFEVAHCQLIPLAGKEPLIAVKRFDRVSTGDALLHRLHQEDFLQAMPNHNNKYEPTDGHYANHCAHLINEESQNPLGDRRMLFSRLLLDWAVGNADNHLKNHSMLWSEDWSSKELSPLYDITCTTIYPEIDKEMGVSFGGSRRIDRVTRNDIMATAQACGVGKKFASDELDELLETFLPALKKATMDIAEQNYPQAADVGERIKASFIARRKHLG